MLLFETANATLENVLSLIELGPDKIVDIGAGLSTVAENASTGIGDGWASIIGKAKDALSK